MSDCGPATGDAVAEQAIEVSVACPMHNEEQCVEEFVRRTDAALRKITDRYEIVIVSDGSTDRTNDLLRELVEQYPALRAVLLSRNMGQCQALYAAIQHTRGRWVVVMDGDLQHLPEEIHLLVDEIRKGYDLVSGCRRNRRDNLLVRRLPSRIANALLRLVTDCPARDMGGFKCIRGDIARSLRLRAGQHRLLPALVYQRGGRVAEIPVTAARRFAGRSHYGVSRALDVMMDIALMWFESSFKARPLYLMGRVALVVTVATVAVMVVLLYQRLFEHQDLTSRPLFYVGLTLLGLAFNLVALGFTLELISDSRNTVNNIKPYVVREVIEHRDRGPAARAGVDRTAERPVEGRESPAA